MIFYYVLLGLFLFNAVLLCIIILLQEGKGTGVGFIAGWDSHDSLFGVGTATVLKKCTMVLAITFMGLALLLSTWTSSLGGGPTTSPIEKTSPQELVQHLPQE